MADNSFVLDTSALMAFIEKEDGAERVRNVLLNPSSFIALDFDMVYISHASSAKRKQ
jgi:PIN domain nuclease of toxin-antitoxin system